MTSLGPASRPGRGYPGFGGGETTGPSPVDRRGAGTKRALIVVPRGRRRRSAPPGRATATVAGSSPPGSTSPARSVRQGDTESRRTTGMTTGPVAARGSGLCEVGRASSPASAGRGQGRAADCEGSSGSCDGSSVGRTGCCGCGCRTTGSECHRLPHPRPRSGKTQASTVPVNPNSGRPWCPLRDVRSTELLALGTAVDRHRSAA